VIHPAVARRIAIFAALAMACSAGPATEEPPPPIEDPGPRTRVVLVGDSITLGQVSRPKGPSYAQLLQRLLGPAFEVVNLGCGGSSSLDWTRSRGSLLCDGKVTRPSLYDARVLPVLPAQFATVLLGTNDSKGIKEERRISAEEYGEALREIATNLLDDGAERVVLMGPPLAAHWRRALMRIVEYGDAVRAICEGNPRVLCGPDVRYLLLLEDFAPGNVHPNGSGHAKIAAALAEFLLAQAQETPGAESESSASSSSEGSSQTRSAPADSSSARLP
jgi:lysophospholipase L1-like esterase